jgi:SAM-dependent methyltransferase
MTLGWRLLPEKYEAFAGLTKTVLDGRSAFAEHYRGGLYAYFDRNPGAAAAYDAAMDTTVDGFEAVGDAYDFTPHRLVVDVGGGHGGLIVALLARFPHLRGIVFDRPAVAAAAAARLDAAGLAHRAESVGGDGFAAVPEGADVYLLSTVLRCFDDERCGRLLRNCRAAMAPDGVLIAFEMVHPDGPWRHPAGLADLDAMVLYGGADRTLGEWRALLDATGFALTDVIPAGAPFSLVCARAADPGAPAT